MSRIPTLFLRNPEDRRFVMPVVQQGCEWVLAGEGTPTRMYDGVLALFDPAAPHVEHADPAELQGWFVEDRRGGELVPAWRSKYARPMAEAARAITDGPRIGSHELLGPKINRDPERIGRHIVIAHADADVLNDAPRDLDGLTTWLLSHPYEGIVWHHPDGRMAKLKRKDVRAR